MISPLIDHPFLHCTFSHFFVSQIVFLMKGPRMQCYIFTVTYHPFHNHPNIAFHHIYVTIPTLSCLSDIKGASQFGVIIYL